jgi:hypothetical protein
MKIIRKISVLSALVTVVFAASSMWALPASAATDTSKDTMVKQAAPKAHKKFRKSTQARKITFSAKSSGVVDKRRAPVVRHTSKPTTSPTWTCSSWGAPATSGGYGQQAVAPAPPAGLACQNPCTTCWTVPQTSWAAPATWGGVAPKARQASPPAPVVTQPPRPTGDQVTVCCNSGPSGTNPVTWKTWCY